MIVNYPTGFYSSILPDQPQSGGNVTYTISNETPPRTNLIFQQLPDGVALRPRPPGVYTPSQRRAVLANLVFITTQASNSVAGSGAKQYEVGQVLDFGDTFAPDATIKQIAPMLVSPSTEIRSDTNLLDLADLGLDNDQITELGDQSAATLKVLQNQLNGIHTQYADAQLNLTGNQKRTNEATKTATALTVMIAVQGQLPVLVTSLQQVTDTLTALNLERTALLTLLNQLTAQATVVNNQMTAVAQLVR